jgi:hypothetical protein
MLNFVFLRGIAKKVGPWHVNGVILLVMFQRLLVSLLEDVRMQRVLAPL